MKACFEVRFPMCLLICSLFHSSRKRATFCPIQNILILCSPLSQDLYHYIKILYYGSLQILEAFPELKFKKWIFLWAIVHDPYSLLCFGKGTLTVFINIYKINICSLPSTVISHMHVPHQHIHGNPLWLVQQKVLTLSHLGQQHVMCTIA